MYFESLEDYVKYYLDNEFAVTPLNGKDAFIPEWQKIRISREQALSYISKGNTNIGIVLGDASGGLVDVDIDDEAALVFAPDFLPETGMKFGRSSSPERHWVYKVREAQKTKRFSASEGMIIELRGNGSQTMFPGSIHPDTAEEIIFSTVGAPGTSSWSVLKTAVVKIAIAAALLPVWIKGRRHNLSLATAGLLAEAGWSEGEAKHFMGVIARHAHDEEAADREVCVETTFRAVEQGKPVASGAMLSGLIGANGETIAKWLGCTPNNHRKKSPLDLSNDAECSRAFSDHNKGILFYAEKDKWYQRNNGVLLAIGHELMQKEVLKTSQYIILNNDIPWHLVAKKFCSVSGINNIIQLSRSNLIVDSELFDTDDVMAGCRNGVLSLDEHNLIDPKDSLITKRLGTEFRANARCPVFEKFITDIFDGDQEMVQFTRRAVGYSLSGSTAEQCLFVLIGAGANGKSTLLNLLGDLFGDYGGTTPMHTLMVQKNPNLATNDLASLVGKRFVAASESEAGSKLAESKIKAMTGGDRIACRHLYKDYFSYVPAFKLWLATNDLPRIDGTTEAIWRRFNVIEFPVTFGPDRRDPHILQKLRAELPGILNWALDGYAQWKLQGLNPPIKVKEATNAYRSENDTVSQFIEICCDRVRNKKQSTAELHAAYEIWCAKNGLDALSKVRFGKELGRLGFEIFRKASGNGWRGICLKDEAILF